MARARTLWEEGTEPGRQVVLLGVAATLTVVVLDLLATGGLGWIYDLAFVARGDAGVATPKSRRFVELFFTLIAVAICPVSMWMVDPEAVVKGDTTWLLAAGVLGIGALLIHIVLYVRARFADPFILPIVVVIPMSFGTASFPTFPPAEYGVRWYVNFFSDRKWMLEHEAAMSPDARERWEFEREFLAAEAGF